jgi:hypothetical protein
MAWGMILELMLIASYPSLFGIIVNWAFVTVGCIGHLAYGAALGVTAKRVVKW